MQYRHWSTDDCWLPRQTEEPLEIFKIDNGHQVVPTGTPEKVPPQWDRKNCLEDVRSTVDKLKDFFTTEEVQWWEDFLQDPSTAATTSQLDVWYLLRLKKMTDAPQAETDPSNGYDMSSPLAPLMQSERTLPQVSFTSMKCVKIWG